MAKQMPALPPFAEKVISKLRRFEECASDSEADGVDIGRHWLDLLTQLGLLNRTQRSPALWEITQQGEDLLAAPATSSTCAKSQVEPFGYPAVPVDRTIAPPSSCQTAAKHQGEPALQQPDDATHYYAKASPDRKWRKQVDGVWCEFCGGSWLPLDHSMELEYLAIEQHQGEPGAKPERLASAPEQQCFVVTRLLDHECGTILKSFECENAATAFRDELAAYEGTRPEWPSADVPEEERVLFYAEKAAWLKAHPGGEDAGFADDFGMTAIPFVRGDARTPESDAVKALRVNMDTVTGMLKDILDLPESQQVLYRLSCGQGTQTASEIWLQARKYIDERAEPPTPRRPPQRT